MRVVAGIWMVIWAIIVFGMLFGWIGNIIEVIAMTVDFAQGDHVARVIGVVFPPLGALMFWFF